MRSFNQLWVPHHHTHTRDPKGVLPLQASSKTNTRFSEEHDFVRNAPPMKQCLIYLGRWRGFPSLLGNEGSESSSFLTTRMNAVSLLEERARKKA
mmetsp:Transcript_13296/g.33544  ORF Transcript_13296/g.33544 Transcript_13296/m.33544 type:complete len:95 (+) Transcript_13296:952-1236(+)